jgi:pimeloyl-ACP methyl ester carboxylesterase
MKATFSRRLALTCAGSALVSAAFGADAPAQPFADSRVIERDRFSVEVVGRGPDLVFMPGLASSRETWRATTERLRGRYRLHLVQLAGFAGEPTRANATGPVLVPTAEAIDAYLAAEHLTPAVLIGHSLGGTIALYLAENHGDHLKAVMLVDVLPDTAQVMMRPGSTADQIAMVATQLRANPAMASGGGEAAAQRLVTNPLDQQLVSSWSKASNPSVVARALADDIELDLRPGLAATKTPITLLYPDNVSLNAPPGAMDAIYVPAYAAAPNKTLVRIDASRHFIMLDQPKAFARALDDFLAHTLG